jgi:hypothetical protein
MLRRMALGVLAALAAAALAAAVEPAAAAPGGTVVPAVTEQGTSPALTPIGSVPEKTPMVVKDHGDDMCPPRANYTPYGPADTSL